MIKGTNLNKTEVLNSQFEFAGSHNSRIGEFSGRKRVQGVFNIHDVTRF